MDKNVRVAILKVAAAAMADPEDVVLFGTSAALGVVTGYAPGRHRRRIADTYTPTRPLRGRLRATQRHARVRVGPYRRWCPRPTGIDLGLHLSRRNVIVNRYQSTIAR